MLGPKISETVFGHTDLPHNSAAEGRECLAGSSPAGAFSRMIRCAYFHEWEIGPSERSRFWMDMSDAVLDRLGQAAARHLGRGETGYFRRPYALRALDDLYAGETAAEKVFPDLPGDTRLQQVLNAALNGMIAPIAMAADLLPVPGGNLHIEAESVRDWLETHRPEIFVRYFASEHSLRRADEQDIDGPGF